MSRRRVAGLLGCGGLLLALTALGLYEQRHDRLGAFVAVALAQGALYVMAVWLLWRGGAPRGSLWLVLWVAAAMRVAVLAAPPYLSDDIYRYIWDGRVAGAGINPYRYIPTDPHLEQLRDLDIFPQINRNNYAPTIYPPLAEAIFFAVTRVNGSVTAMKMAMVVFDAITVALLLRLLVAAGLPAGRIVIYAWHPLPLWEFAGSGHIDAAVVALVAVALWSRHHSRGWLTGWLTGLALAGGVLVKYYPALLFPALWRRWQWSMPAAFAVALILAYLPFIGAGWGVLGFLPGYLAEEGLTGGGGGFYLWSVLQAILPFGPLPGPAYIAGIAVLLAGIAAFVTFARAAAGHDFTGAATLATVFMLLLSPHYPWYFAWLILFATLLPCVSLLWLTLASFLLYLIPVGSHLVRDRHRMIVESVIYLPFAVLALIDLWRRRRGSR